MSLSTPTTCASIGCATVASTTAEFAPGYMVVTDTCGGTISGYCATGIAMKASAPAIVVITAMTIASRGRSTKIADIMGSAPVDRLRDRACAHGHPRAQALKSLDDDELAAGETLVDDDARPTLARGRHAPDDSLAVVRDEHVHAFLIGDQSARRDDDLVLGLVAFQSDAYELTIDQPRLGIRKCRTYQHRVRCPIDADVDEIDRAPIFVYGIVAKAQLCLDAF